MNKILITGIVASGKTTFAKQLSAALDIPWHELDAIGPLQEGKRELQKSSWRSFARYSKESTGYPIANYSKWPTRSSSSIRRYGSAE